MQTEGLIIKQVKEVSGASKLKRGNRGCIREQLFQHAILCIHGSSALSLNDLAAESGQAENVLVIIFQVKDGFR
jgi:hypothetical protein